jgi:hypothetical protein
MFKLGIACGKKLSCFCGGCSSVVSDASTSRARTLYVCLRTRD